MTARTLQGKVCVVSGAGAGIRQAVLDRIIDTGGVAVPAGDFDATSEAGWIELFAGVGREFGRLDGLVNVAAVGPADDTFPAYCTSKGAVLALTEEVAIQCARRGDAIRCNAILPATIRTSMTVDVVDDPAWASPIGRVGEPEEVAALAAFLCSEDAVSLNGTGHAIDGGFLA